MDMLRTNIKHNLSIQKYFPKEKACFVDIETTGLNRFKDNIYLIGILYPSNDNGTWVLDQYFADNLDEENKVLNEFIANIIKFNKIITYNGDYFDIPFIKQRIRHYKLNNPFSNIKSFDLYQYVKKYRFLFNFTDLKLKTIEKELGFFREDIYSGLDCVDFYFKYIESKNPVLKENILNHNFDDLAHMLDVISIIDLIEDKKGISINKDEGSIELTIEKIQFSQDILKIEGTVNPPLENNIKYFHKNFNLVTEDKRNFTFSLESNLGLITREEKCRYIDLEEIGIKNLINSENFNLPPNIFILSIENKYCIDNIRNLLSEIVKLLIK